MSEPILIGRHPISQEQQFAAAGHVLTFAPTGSDRQASVVRPTLENYSGAMMLLDPDGESWRTTSQRRREMGQTVIRIDPFGMQGAPAEDINLFEMFAFDSVLIDPAIEEVARLVFERKGPHRTIDSMAFNLVRGAVGYTSAVPERRNLGGVVDALSGDDVVYNLAVVIDTIGGKIPPLTYSDINGFLQLKDPFRSEILAEAVSGLLRSPHAPPRRKKDIQPTTIPLSDIMNGNCTSTIYLIIPSDKIGNCGHYIRYWFGGMMTAFSSWKGDSRGDMLFFLDDVASIGRFGGLESALLSNRPAASRIWAIWDEVSQLRSYYPQSWETMFARAGTVQLLSNQDYLATAELASLLGIRTENISDLASNEQVVRHDQTVERLKTPAAN